MFAARHWPTRLPVETIPLRLRWKRPSPRQRVDSGGEWKLARNSSSTGGLVVSRKQALRKQRNRPLRFCLDVKLLRRRDAYYGPRSPPTFGRYGTVGESLRGRADGKLLERRWQIGLKGGFLEPRLQRFAPSARTGSRSRPTRLRNIVVGLLPPRRSLPGSAAFGRVCLTQ
jgi:hypothetical protein